MMEYSKLLKVRTRAGRDFTLPVEGTSMLPTLRPGQRVQIAPVDPRDLVLGDVVAVAGSHGVVVHRLVKRKKRRAGYFLCVKGDALSGWRWHGTDRLLGRMRTRAGPWRRFQSWVAWGRVTATEALGCMLKKL